MPRHASALFILFPRLTKGEKRGYHLFMAQEVLDFLDKLGIKYTLYTHPAVVSVEESKRVLHIQDARGYKSLFVKDKKSQRFFLVVLPNNKRADMRALARYVGAEKFEFASQSALSEYLNVARGSVSPFCFVSPHAKDVGLLLDKEIGGQGKVRFHPCDNTKTVALESGDFIKFLQAFDKKIIWVE